MSVSNVLIKMTGSISAYKICELISRLNKEGHKVQVVCTKNALEFVGRATLEGLSQNPLIDSTFLAGHPMDHIELDRWADVVLLAPATANTINKLAHGIADDIVSNLFLAHDREKPYIIAPAMNTKMYNHPATQSSLKKLMGWGATVLHTEEGPLACGEYGEGRLLNIDAIYKALFEDLTPKTKSKGSLLVTGGGTQEPIDGVRYIANFSTGKTAAHLADAFQKFGFDVTLLCAKSSVRPQNSSIKIKEFSDFDSLEHLLRFQLSNFSYKSVIHLAAVSDFSVKPHGTGKIPSGTPLQLNLRPNPKLIHSLKNWSKNRNISVIGFKLTKSQDLQVRDKAISKLLNHKDVDYVVHNDLNEIFDSNHTFRIYSKNKKISQCNNKNDLSLRLLDIIETEDHPEHPNRFQLNVERQVQEQSL